MNIGPQGYVSNSMKELTFLLSKKIFQSSSGDSLPRINLVVPSQAMQEHLRLELARLSPEKVLFGVRFVYLSEAVAEIQKKLFPSSRRPFLLGKF